MTQFRRSLRIALALSTVLLSIGFLSASTAGAQKKGTEGQLAAGKRMPLFDVNTTAKTVTVGTTEFTVTEDTRFYDAQGNRIRMSDLRPVVGSGSRALVMVTTKSIAVSGGRELISLNLVTPISD